MRSSIDKVQPYLAFLAYCLDDHPSVLPDVSRINWEELHSFSQEQAVQSIVFDGVNRLSNEGNNKLSIPTELVYTWFAQVNIIELQNKLVNQRTIEISEFFTKKGIENCILKGQGNSRMYPNPSLRAPGDIDVWIDGTKEEIASFVHQTYPKVVVGDHHMDYPIFHDVEVEVHYYPSFCYNYIHNKRLQKYFGDNRYYQFEHISKEGYATPTTSFNLVFQLSHMMRHFFTQGIGLRHAIDYYYLLKQDISDSDKRAVVIVLKDCGMYKFFRALMWIETEILGLGKNTDIAPPHKRAGVLVLHEMIKGGNFGKQYSRWGNKVLAIYAHQLFYNLRYVFEFPVEPISRPFYLLIEYLKRHLFHKN